MAVLPESLYRDSGETRVRLVETRVIKCPEQWTKSVQMHKKHQHMHERSRNAWNMASLVHISTVSCFFSDGEKHESLFRDSGETQIRKCPDFSAEKEKAIPDFTKHTSVDFKNIPTIRFLSFLPLYDPTQRCLSKNNDSTRHNFTAQQSVSMPHKKAVDLTPLPSEGSPPSLW